MPLLMDQRRVFLYNTNEYHGQESYEKMLTRTLPATESALMRNLTRRRRKKRRSRCVEALDGDDFDESNG